MANEPSMLVVQDPAETLRELTDLDREIQNQDEEIVAKKAALREAQEKREQMVAQLRAKLRTAFNPMPMLPLFEDPPNAPRDSEDLGGAR